MEVKGVAVFLLEEFFYEIKMQWKECMLNLTRDKNKISLKLTSKLNLK